MLVISGLSLGPPVHELGDLERLYTRGCQHGSLAETSLPNPGPLRGGHLKASRAVRLRAPAPVLRMPVLPFQFSGPELESSSPLT